MKMQKVGSIFWLTSIPSIGPSPSSDFEVPRVGWKSGNGGEMGDDVDDLIAPTALSIAAPTERDNTGHSPLLQSSTEFASPVTVVVAPTEANLGLLIKR